MNKILFALLVAIASSALSIPSVKADTVSGTITMVNRSGRFDIDGGIKNKANGGITSFVPDESVTTLVSATTKDKMELRKIFRAGSKISMNGEFLPNGIFQPTSATITE